MRQVLNLLLSFSRVRLCWSGIVNQGHYFVMPGQIQFDIGCGSSLYLFEAKVFGADVREIEADSNVKRIADSLGLNVDNGSLFDKLFFNEKYDFLFLTRLQNMPLSRTYCIIV